MVSDNFVNATKIYVVMIDDSYVAKYDEDRELATITLQVGLARPFINFKSAERIANLVHGKVKQITFGGVDDAVSFH